MQYKFTHTQSKSNGMLTLISAALIRLGQLLYPKPKLHMHHGEPHLPITVIIVISGEALIERRVSNTTRTPCVYLFSPFTFRLRPSGVTTLTRYGIMEGPKKLQTREKRRYTPAEAKTHTQTDRIFSNCERSLCVFMHIMEMT